MFDTRNSSLLNQDSRQSQKLSDSTLRSIKKTISDYDVLEILGQGAFGTVHKVRDKSDGGIFAMKAISKFNLNEQSIFMLRQELRIHKYLRHPHITKLYAFFEDAQSVYLVIALAENGRPW